MLTKSDDGIWRDANDFDLAVAAGDADDSDMHVCDGDLLKLWAVEDMHARLDLAALTKQYGKKAAA